MQDIFNFSGVSLEKLLQPSSSFIVFGAGQAACFALRQLKSMGQDVLFVCDNDTSKHGSMIEGLSIKAPEALLEKPEVPVLIASDYCREIGLQLKKMMIHNYFYFGFCADYDRWKGHFEPDRLKKSCRSIRKAFDLFSDLESQQTFTELVRFRYSLCPDTVKTSSFEEYFHPGVKPDANMTIADAGAWNGDTAESFHRALHGNCKIFSFEPDADNFRALNTRISEHQLGNKVVPCRLGLWSKSTVLKFSNRAENSMQFLIDEAGEIEIPVTSLDEFSQHESVSFDLIKMDIEGAEIEALKGARKTIIKDRPDLQICAYHQFGDLWEIPILIKEILPEYRLFLGHHTQHFIDTIVYATCR